jgi:hypothetical protein
MPCAGHAAQARLGANLQDQEWVLPWAWTGRHTQMGILNFLGRNPESEYRTECEALARRLFSDAPIDAANAVFLLFSHGGAIEVLKMKGFSRVDAEGGAHEIEDEMRKLFNSAKIDGPGSESDQSVRAMARTIAAATARQGPIIIVAELCEVLKEVRNRNWATNWIDDLTSFEEVTKKAASRSQYLRTKYAEMT